MSGGRFAGDMWADLGLSILDGCFDGMCLELWMGDSVGSGSNRIYGGW